MEDVALWVQVEGFPDAEEQEGAVGVVRCRLGGCVEQPASGEDGNEEAMLCDMEMHVLLLRILRRRTFLLHGCYPFQFLCVCAARLDVGIAFLHDAEEALV